VYAYGPELLTLKTNRTIAQVIAAEQRCPSSQQLGAGWRIPHNLVFIEALSMQFKQEIRKLVSEKSREGVTGNECI